MISTLISAAPLAEAINGPAEWVIVDCRSSLVDLASGERAYRRAHIPGAVYAHLENDLSDMSISGRGRHPLPPPEKMVALFSRLGIEHGRQVVVYDNDGGAYAARLWWMLRYMGHEAVAVLNGGWAAWLEAGFPIKSGWEENSARYFVGLPRPGWVVESEQVMDGSLVVDSRDGARYRGEIESIDPVAGHIPGAVNYFYRDNVDSSGRFRPADQLRQQLLTMLAETLADEAIFYCGSGVTACHNLLAQVYAGLPQGRLYAGSWSEWSNRPGLPVAVGP